MDITPYKLADAAFWTSDDRGADRLGTELVGEYQGILVDAPRRVPIDQRQTLPAGIYYLGSIRELATVRLEKHGVITLMDVTHNRLSAVNGGRTRPETDIIERKPVDPSKMAEGDMSTVLSVELRKLFGIPWKPARYLYTVLLRDKVSNRAEIELCQSASCYVDPEVVKYQEAQRAKVNAQAAQPRPGVPLPSYRRQPESPPLPEQPGLSVTAARLVDLDREPRWLVRGAFRLKPLPEETVKPGWTDPFYTARAAEPKPVAVVGITLLVTGADDGSFYVFPLQVPAFGRVGQVVTGYFALDALQLPNAPRKPQTYFIYAFSGETMAGPLASALVRPKP